MGKMLIVTSGKGGTGKTMMAVNLSASLAEMGKSVVLCDMNIGLRNADLLMGKENDVVYDSSDVIREVCGLDQALVKDDRFDSMYLLAAAPEHEEGVTVKKMAALLETLKGRFDFVIVDMPSDDVRVAAFIARSSDKVILVSTADYASLRNTDALDGRLVSLGQENQTVIINRLVPEFMNEGVVPKLREIARMLRPEIAGVIQEDRVIQVSSNLGVPVIMKQGTYIKKNFEQIAMEFVNS